MKLEKIKNVYFNRRWYIPSNFIENIKFFFRGIKYSIHRAKYGVSSIDCWDLDYYLNRVIYNSLQIYKKDTNGYPMNLSEEEWNEILDKMIYYSGELLKDESENNDKLFTKYLETKKEEDRQAWSGDCIEFEKHKKFCRQMLFNYLNEYEENLWW